MPELQTARENARLEIGSQRGRNSHQIGTIDFFSELTDDQRQSVLFYQLDAVGVLAKGEHRHRVPGSLACPRGCAGSLGLRK